MDDINRAIWELEQKTIQLSALILFLKEAGPTNPQYHQIKNCEDEYQLAQSQINQLVKIQQNCIAKTNHETPTSKTSSDHN